MNNNFKLVEEKIKYSFKNKSLLKTAFTQSAYANSKNIQSNERLEFLGDSVLNLITTDYLYKHFKDGEGDLSKLRAFVVSSKNLYKVIEKLSLEEFIKYESSVVMPISIKADLFEAILGAIYLDGGMQPATEFVYRELNYNPKNLKNLMENSIDYKTLLQEKVQSEKEKQKIDYILIKKTGPSHSPTFEVAIALDNKQKAKAKAGSKKEAENLAAKKLLNKIK